MFMSARTRVLPQAFVCVCAHTGGRVTAPTAMTSMGLKGWGGVCLGEGVGEGSMSGAQAGHQGGPDPTASVGGSRGTDNEGSRGRGRGARRASRTKVQVDGSDSAQRPRTGRQGTGWDTQGQDKQTGVSRVWEGSSYLAEPHETSRTRRGLRAPTGFGEPRT